MAQSSDVKEPTVALGAGAQPASAAESSTDAPQEQSPVRFGSFDTPLPDTPSDVWKELETKPKPETPVAGEQETETTEEATEEGATPETAADTETQAEIEQPTTEADKPKDRTAKAFNRLRQTTAKTVAEKNAEIEMLRQQLARQTQRPVVSDVPKELLDEYSREYASYQKKQQEGLATAEDWIRVDSLRFKVHDKQTEANLIRQVNLQRQQEKAQEAFQRRLLSYHEFSPILKTTPQGVQLDFASPLMMKAQQLAAHDGMDLGQNLFLYLAESKAELAGRQQTTLRREAAAARAASALEGTGTPAPSGGGGSGDAEYNRLRKLSDSGDQDATRRLMEHAYARSKRK